MGFDPKNNTVDIHSDNTPFTLLGSHGVAAKSETQNSKLKT